MPLSLISPSEIDFIFKGVDDNIRADGRGRLDYRQVSLETGVISQASGSARCKLGEGTDVLVGVKIEIGAIEIDGNYEQVMEIKSKRGRVVCNVECSPIASQQFAGKGAEDINNELTQTIERVFNGPQGGINLEKLCIIPGQQCWVVYIDALVLDYAGNILDTIFITTRAALYNARVPKTIIQDHGDGEFEFEISDDVEEWERIYGWDMVPVGVTLNRIGTRHIVDATPLEELATEAKLLTTDLDISDEETSIVEDYEIDEKKNHVHSSNNDKVSRPPSLIPSSEFIPTFMSLKLPQTFMFEHVDSTKKSTEEKVIIYKRHLADVKFQIAQEDEDLVMDNNQKINNPSNILELSIKNDLIEGVYEGGLKTWECSFDLLDYFINDLQNFDFDNINKILELGCGTSLPGIYLLSKYSSLKVDFQDYNEQVLKLITIPNILLNTILRSKLKEINEKNEEIEIIKNDKLFNQLKKSRFFMGDWGDLVDVINIDSEENKYDMIITSETIYNINSLPKLYNVIKNTLKRPNGVAYVAAKSIYFGVGGSMLTFREFVEQDNIFEVKLVKTVEAFVKREILQLSFSKIN
ncbi:5399_t:CDS:10 [Entrophospora sp. SA101]|nr:2110_t:CDS:10 [Entrophospora sp. SA101]CAJ0834097.1 5399_t:CDS:10 [Entrophospora sp. SA101]